MTSLLLLAMETVVPVKVEGPNWTTWVTGGGFAAVLALIAKAWPQLKKIGADKDVVYNERLVERTATLESEVKRLNEALLTMSRQHEAHIDIINDLNDARYEETVRLHARELAYIRHQRDNDAMSFAALVGTARSGDAARIERALDMAEREREGRQTKLDREAETIAEFRKESAERLAELRRAAADRIAKLRGVA